MDDEMRSLLESIPDGGPISIDQLATAAAKQGRRRRLLRVVPAVVAVAVVIVIGGLAWGAAQSPSSTVDVQGQPLGTMPSPDPSAEEYVYPDKLLGTPGGSPSTIRSRWPSCDRLTRTPPMSDSW